MLSEIPILSISKNEASFTEDRKTLQGLTASTLNYARGGPGSLVTTRTLLSTIEKLIVRRT